MMFRLLILTLISAISWQAPAHESNNCATRLDVTPITFTARPDQAHEIRVGGQIFSVQEQLPKMPTNAYNYVITQDGFLALAPKYELGGAVKHKALLRRLADHLNKPMDQVNVLAAGEISLAFDQVTLINNRSGNLKGDESRVAIAESIFKRMGFVFTGDTQRKAYDPAAVEMDGHTPKGVAVDVFQLELRQRLRAFPKSERWRAFFAELGAILLTQSEKKTVLDLPNLIIDAAVAGNRWLGIHEFSYPFIHACTVDGFDFGLLKAIESHQLTPERVALQLQNLIDYRPEAKTQLEKLRTQIPN